MKIRNTGMPLLLVTLLTACAPNGLQLLVQKASVLKNFPSGSAIEYYQDNIFLLGDDAAKLLVLDTGYRQIDSLTLFESEQLRIPKEIKADLEASTILEVNGMKFLAAIGSASLPPREKMILIPLTTPADRKTISTSLFFQRLKRSGINNVNIEGATHTGTGLLLVNRGNLAHQSNHFIFTDSDFWKHQDEAFVQTSEVVLPPTQTFAGISGMAYIRDGDVVLFSASTELTANSIDDGAIGDSYLGWVKKISTKMGNKKITVDGLLNLSAQNEVFFGEKIESVCVSASVGNAHTIHLVSDNDDGESKLFTVRLVIP